MQNKIMIALAMMLFATTANATPRYDVASHCKEVAEFGGYSSVIYNACIEQEQTAYDSLKANWDNISSKTTSYCDEIACFGGCSYTILESCIEQETGASNNTTEFKY